MKKYPKNINRDKYYNMKNTARMNLRKDRDGDANKIESIAFHH